MHPEKGIKDFPDNGQYSLRILRIKVARLPDRITPRNDSKSGQCESHRERLPVCDFSVRYCTSIQYLQP
jgi:hypothetical protein